jgi:hypothetical protein
MVISFKYLILRDDEGGSPSKIGKLDFYWPIFKQNELNVWLQTVLLG